MVIAWLYVVHHSDKLFMLVKYVTSSDEIRKDEFEFNGVLEHGHEGNSALRCSILIRCVVEFFILVGMCLAFLLSPSLKGMMMDLSLSMTIINLDGKLFFA